MATKVITKTINYITLQQPKEKIKYLILKKRNTLKKDFAKTLTRKEINSIICSITKELLIRLDKYIVSISNLLIEELPKSDNPEKVLNDIVLDKLYEILNELKKENEKFLTNKDKKVIELIWTKENQKEEQKKLDENDDEYNDVLNELNIE